MKPWHKSEFQLEQKFEHVVDIYNKTKSEESEQVGACLVTLITLCQDVDNLPSEEEKNKFWSTIENDVQELLIATDQYLKNNNNI